MKVDNIHVCRDSNACILFNLQSNHQKVMITNNRKGSGGPWKRFCRVIAGDEIFLSLVLIMSITVAVWVLTRAIDAYNPLIFGSSRVRNSFVAIREFFISMPFLVNIIFLEHVPTVIASIRSLQSKKKSGKGGFNVPSIFFMGRKTTDEMELRSKSGKSKMFISTTGRSYGKNSRHEVTNASAATNVSRFGGLRSGTGMGTRMTNFGEKTGSRVDAASPSSRGANGPLADDAPAEMAETRITGYEEAQMAATMDLRTT
jgi:hypothetical protein